MKLELLTNAAVVDEALKFVSSRIEKNKAHVSTIIYSEKPHEIQGSAEKNNEYG